MNKNKPLMHAILFSCSGLLVIAIAFVTFQPDVSTISNTSEPDSAKLVVPAIDEPIQPLPQYTARDKKKIYLGELLFNDPRLSNDDSISCATCHNLETGGVDRLARSVGVYGNVGDINSPTVFNSGLNIAQFWDGRAETLEDQIDGPTHNPKEMGSSWAQITEKLSSDKTYQALFKNSYSDGITSVNIKDAIASFEKSLVTINSPFDRYLRGEKDAISANAKAGYQLFKEFGCISCHQGSNVGGNVFQKFGVMGDYFSDRGSVITQADFGRFNVTGLEEDKFVFRVPSLRLATLTPPYFHDGSVNTIEEAVRTMVRYQLGRMSSEKDEELIVAFLHTLVGEYNGRPLGQ